MFSPTIENLAFLKGLILSGWRTNDIADYLGCNRHTVSRWKNKFYEYPLSFMVDARCFNGNNKSLTLDDIENIKLLWELDPFTPATKIKEELMLDCSVRLVRRVMREELDLHCFTPATKNKLIHLDKIRRMQFALSLKNVTSETWRNTIFIDEKTFSTHKDGRLIVWRPKNMR